MSQPDLIAQLREHRPTAPHELRAHLRQLAATAPTPRKRLTWRRGLVLAFAALALAVVAAALIPRSGDEPRTAGQSGREGTYRPAAADSLEHAGSAPSGGADFGLAAPAAAKAAESKTLARVPGSIPPPSGTNAQRYLATLSLRLKDATAVSEATNKALKITAALGGHPNTVNVDAERKDGEAYLVLKVPRARVQDAVQKLGALGTIVGANVSIQDLQAGIDTQARTLERLKERLAELRAEVQTEDVVAQVETLEQRIENLQRQRAATIRAAQFATVKLHMETPPAAAPAAEEGNGPLHGLGVAFRWIGIGAIYVLALGTPVVLLVALGWFLARVLRRRREEALLARA